MYDITVTLIKEVGIGKKVKKNFPKATDYGWLEEAPVFFIQTGVDVDYFNLYEFQQVTVKDLKIKSVQGPPKTISKVKEL